MKDLSGPRAEAAGAAEERIDEAAKRVSPFRAWFGKVATRASNALGSAWAFGAALLLILAWIVTGPIFGFSDTWQLVITTCTGIVTFLMVFLIQNTQNRDSKAAALKLDELIRAIEGARNQFIGAELEPEDYVEREKRALQQEKHTRGGAAADRASQAATQNGTPRVTEPAGHR